MAEFDEIVTMRDVRAALMVLINAWYRKMKLPEMVRKNAKPPVLSLNEVSNLLSDMTSLSYMKPVADKSTGKIVYQETEPMDDGSGKLARYKKIHERLNDTTFLRDTAIKLNKAMFSDETHDNFLNKMHGSLIAAMLRSKNTDDHKMELHTTNEPLSQGQTCWFTLDSVISSMKMRHIPLDKLIGHLCTYQLYHQSDIKGGLTGKVIVCAQSAAGIDHIPERIAVMINKALRNRYGVQVDYAIPKDLSEVEYNLDGGVNVETKVRNIIRKKGLRNIGMNKGVEIADGPLIKYHNDLIEPRKAVSDLFMSGELDITCIKAMVYKSGGTQTKQQEDVDDEHSYANHQEADITRGHSELQYMGTDEVRQQLLNTLKIHMDNMQSYVNLLNAVASRMDVDPDNLDTAWKVVDGYENPSMTDDMYVNLANTVTRVSKYIIDSTTGAFSKEYAPFAVAKLFDNENVTFASNVYPDKSGSTADHNIRLDAYQAVMSQIFDSMLSENKDNAFRRLVTSAKGACSNIVSFVTGVYKLLEPALHSYEGVDASTLSAKKESSALVKTINATTINVAAMDKFIGFDSVTAIHNLTGLTLSPELPLDKYLDNVETCLNEMAHRIVEKTGGNEDDIYDQKAPEKYKKINNAITTLSNGTDTKDMSLDNANTFLANVMRAVAVSPEQSVKPSVPTPPTKPTEPIPASKNQEPTPSTKDTNPTSSAQTEPAQQPKVSTTKEPPKPSASTSTVTPSEPADMPTEENKPLRRRSNRFNMDKV